MGNGRIHDFCKVIGPANRQGATGQRHELIAGAYLEPGIAGQQVHLIRFGNVIKLMGGVFQAIVKTRPWRAFFKFSVKFIGKGRGVYQMSPAEKITSSPFAIGISNTREHTGPP